MDKVGTFKKNLYDICIGIRAGNDDLSREQALALQHENAALKAQLLSITALCSDPFSGINVKRPKSVGKPGDEGKDGGPPQKVSTLRAVSLDICERATALSLQPAQEDTPVISQADVRVVVESPRFPLC